MLTVKHLSNTGSADFYSCEEATYSRLSSAPFPLVLTLTGGRRRVITVRPGDVVYINNLAGKSEDVIRPAVAVSQA